MFPTMELPAKIRRRLQVSVWPDKTDRGLCQIHTLQCHNCCLVFFLLLLLFISVCLPLCHDISKRRCLACILPTETEVEDETPVKESQGKKRGRYERINKVWWQRRQCRIKRGSHTTIRAAYVAAGDGSQTWSLGPHWGFFALTLITFAQELYWGLGAHRE